MYFDIDNTLGEISNGSLDVGLREVFQGGFAALETSISKIIGSMNSTLGQIDVASDQVPSGSNQMADGSQKVIVIVDEIAKNSREQATSVTLATRGVEQISGVVQATSATAEESAASSEDLASQAQTIKHLVGRFSLKSGLTAMQYEENSI